MERRRFWLVAILIVWLCILSIAGDRTTPEAQASGRRPESLGWIGSRDMAETHYNRGKRYYKRAKYDKAIEELEITLSLDPEDKGAKSLLRRAKARMRAAESLERLRARREAIKVAERRLRRGTAKDIRPISTKLAKEEPSEVEREREKEIRESYNKGRTHYREKEYGKAIEQFQKVLALEPGHAGALRYLKRAQKRMERVAKAKARAQRIAIEEAKRIQREAERKKREQQRLLRNEVESHYRKGMDLYRDHRYKLAIEQFKKALELDPNYKRAANYLERSRKRMGEAKVEELRAKKEAYAKARKEAERKAREAEKMKLKAMKEVERTIRIELEKRRKQEAELKREAERKARREEIERQKAQRRAEQETRAEAEAERKRREELQLAAQKTKEERKRAKREARAIREEARTHFNEGKAYYLNGSYGEAIEQFKKALELDPNYTRAANYLERSRKRMGEAKVEEPRAKKEAYAKARKEAERRAKEEARRKKEEETRLAAKIAREEVLKRKVEEKKREKEIRGYYLEGKRLFRAGRYQEAIERFEKVIELEGNPRRVYTPSARRYIERAKQKIKEAEAKALREKVRSHCRKGMDLYRKERYEEAIEEFQKALSLDPSYTRAARYIERARAKIEVPKAKKLEVEEREARRSLRELRELEERMAEEELELPEEEGIRAHFDRGELFYKEGDYSASIIEFRKVWELDAHHPLVPQAFEYIEMAYTKIQEAKRLEEERKKAEVAEVPKPEVPKELIEEEEVVEEVEAVARREGKVIALSDEYNFVVIDLGEADGIEKGMEFSVYRRGRWIGKIKVIELRKHLSAANVEETLRRRKLREGDVVRP